MDTEKTIAELEKRVKRASGDQRGRLKARILVLKNNLWLSKPWALETKKSWWQVLHG